MNPDRDQEDKDRAQQSSDTAKDLSPHLTSDSYRHSRILVWLGIWLLLGIHAGLLAYSAARHSPTVNEPAHLVAGISNWKFRRFELYRVDPPLTRMIAALPVLVAGCETDWSGFFEGPGARPVFSMGRRFIAVNGQRSIWLFTIARWACIPISLAGGLACFLWARELYGSTSGFFALTLWCFSPNILAHAELVTPDAAATSFGILAGYTFWRWLKFPTWSRATIAGFALGLAEISKMSWVILLGLWPLLWLFWLSTAGEREWKTWLRTAGQLFLILLVGLYVLNLTYLFDGSFTQAKDFTFVSSTLTGREEPGLPGNRFRETLLGKIPIPVPKQYLLGMDIQKHDFEDCAQPSYLRGRWKDGGWWYYYLYGLCVKVPHGTQLLFGLALLTTVSVKWRSWRDEVVLLAPVAALFALISSQVEYNHHFRYVLPSIGLLLIFLAKTGFPFAHRHATSNIDSHSATFCSTIGLFRLCAMVCLAGSVASALCVYPHSIAYFNEWAGGPKNGHQRLLGSNLNWGQDLLFIADWVDQHPEAQPLTIANVRPFDRALIDLRIPATPQYVPQDREWMSESALKYVGPQPGWHIVDLRCLRSRNHWYAYFCGIRPVDRIGYTYHVFHLTAAEANKLRSALGLGPLQESGVQRNTFTRVRQSDVPLCAPQS